MDQTLQRSKNLASIKKTVSFDKVVVREYERELGDNPAVRCGLPLSIGWKYFPSPAVPLEEYETTRPSEDRRKDQQLMIGAGKRYNILLNEYHVPMEKIKTVLKEIKTIKESRFAAACEDCASE